MEHRVALLLLLTLLGCHGTRTPLEIVDSSAHSDQEVTVDQVLKSVGSADFLLLAISEDSAPQLRAAASILDQVAGHESVVAFGLIPAVDAIAFPATPLVLMRGAPGRTPQPADLLAENLAWATRGWPPFEHYRPVLQATYEAGSRPIPVGSPMAAQGSDPYSRRQYSQVVDDMATLLVAESTGAKPAVLIGDHRLLRIDRGVPSLLSGEVVTIGIAASPAELRQRMGKGVPTLFWRVEG